MPTHARCIVQEGQITADMQAELREAVTNFVRTEFHTEPQLVWIEVKEGYGYTAGEPSRASIIAVISPVALEQSRRATLLRKLVDSWSAITGCSLNDVVAVINDPEPVS